MEAARVDHTVYCSIMKSIQLQHKHYSNFPTTQGQGIHCTHLDKRLSILSSVLSPPFLVLFAYLIRTTSNHEHSSLTHETRNLSQKVFVFVVRIVAFRFSKLEALTGSYRRRHGDQRKSRARRSGRRVAEGAIGRRSERRWKTVSKICEHSRR